MANKRRRVASLLVLLFIMMLVGCGGSSASSPTKTGSGVLTGNWQFALKNTTIVNPLVSKEAGFLAQDGKQIGGNLTFQSAKCSGSGSVTGTADGTRVLLKVNQPGLDVNLTGDSGMESLDATGTMVCTPGSSLSGSACMTGTYVLFARGCGKSESGTWSAFQVQSLTQTLSGTFTDTQSGGSTTLTAALTQGAAGGTSALISGTLTPAVPSGRGVCVAPGGATSASLTGQISGNNVILTTIIGPDNTVGTVKGQIQAVWYPLGNGTFTEPVLDFTNTPAISKGTSYVFNYLKSCNLFNDPSCIVPDLSNPKCVIDHACVPDPTNPDKCPGPSNSMCTGIKSASCESGAGTLCKSGAC